MTYYANSAKSYFTRKEALEAVREVIANGYDGYYCDLHNEVFNMDYYIIGICEAKNALEEYDVFEAIENIIEYERDNFGEVNTKFTRPEEIANMLWYIVGEEAIGELESVTGDRWNERADEESNTAVLEELDSLLEEED